jgi:Glycosyl hydrolase family 26
MKWTARVVACLAIVGSATAIATPPASASGPVYPSVLRPSKGVYLGTFVKPRRGESPQQAITRVETRIGRKFAIDHRYYKWDSTFPNSYDTWSWSKGRKLYMAWNARKRNGTVTSWRSIANGSWDALIRKRAQAIKAWGHPMYLTFHHEPENDGKFGSKADFIAAFRHIVTVFHNVGVRNVAFVWTLMGNSFINGTAGSWYPGNAYVDFVGSDTYNWYPGRKGTKWRSFAQGVGPTVAFAKAHSKPVMVAEYGCQEDPNHAGRKGDWFRNELTALKQWPIIKAVVYFDSPTIYPWVTDSTKSSMSGYRALASSVYLHP